MPDMIITVHQPGTPPATYAFTEYPVTIGRLDTSTLSICHAAIPRELCTVWHDDGRGVIVLEEKPDLTNPLLYEGGVVRGGLELDDAVPMDVCIGPFRISIRLDTLGRNVAATRSGRPQRQRVLLWGIGILLMVACYVAHRQKESTAHLLRAAHFPAAPFVGSCCGGPPAEIAITRAKNLLSRRPDDPHARLEALRMLRRRDISPGDHVAFSTLEQDVTQDYRRTLLALIRAHNAGQSATTRKIAQRLTAYLKPEQVEAHSFLKHIQTKGHAQ